MAFLQNATPAAVLTASAAISAMPTATRPAGCVDAPLVRGVGAGRDRPSRGSGAGAEETSKRFKRSSTASASSDGAPPSIAACSRPPSFVAVPALIRGDAVLQQLFGLALPFGQRTPRPVDVGARSRMTPIEEQRPGPDVDGELVAGGEVMIEADEQELLDFGVLRTAIRDRRDIRVSARAVGTERIGHKWVTAARS